MDWLERLHSMPWRTQALQAGLVSSHYTTNNRRGDARVSGVVALDGQKRGWEEGEERRGEERRERDATWGTRGMGIQGVNGKSS